MRNTLFLAFILIGVVSAVRASPSFIIIDDQTGHILAAEGENKKRQVASLTKIACAMVVLDWVSSTGGSLASIATVPPQVFRVGGANPCNLQPGDRLSLRDLLYAAMMTSDNRAAYTLAHHVGRLLPNSQMLRPADNFTAQMNALGRQLEMKRTLFLNPHGLDNLKSPPHSTAADLARLTRYAYRNSGFNFYVSQPAREIRIEDAAEKSRKFLLRNTNQLLGQEGIEGVKTGRTARAGDCLILASSRSPQPITVQGRQLALPRRIIVVLLASPNRFREGLQLIHRGWNLHERWSGQGRPISKRSGL